MKLAFVTLADDLHAYIIRDKVKKRSGFDVAIIEVDRLLGVPAFSCKYDDRKFHAAIPSLDGSKIHINDVDLVWWRRARADQEQSKSYDDEGTADLVNQDWRSSLRGVMETSYTGHWVSRPDHTERASFKIYQLQKSLECGFRIPKTLISNCPDDVRSFCSDVGGRFIVKPVAGSRHLLLSTELATSEKIPNDETIAVAPTIYQEVIEGHYHLRINQFGHQQYAFMIDSNNLDWRQQLPNKISFYIADRKLVSMCNELLNNLQLRMGVIDVKIDQNGEPVFFEINPQGQFLFLEGITGFPISDRFADFIISELDDK